MIGAILSLAIFNTKVAIAAILMTTLGDLSAALISKRFGRHFFMKERAWEGTLAELSVDITIGVFVFIVFSASLSVSHAWLVISVMAITATIVETLIYQIDDNLIIPLFTGFNGQIVLIALGYI